MTDPIAARLLEVQELTTTFQTDRGHLPAVDAVSLDVEQGRTLGIVGESGSGKTVLIRSIMGLLPWHRIQLSGRVLFEGEDLVAMPNRDLRRLWGTQIAMVFQDPMTSLSPVQRIGRQLTDGMRHHLGLGRAEAKELAVDLLRSVGIPAPQSRFKAHPHELSGGMRQRVTIAIALSCGPKLLLADEPTTALDVTVQAQILDLLGREQANRNMGMILVSHDLDVVAGRTDEIAVMYAGHIVERAPTRRLFTNPRMPYTEALLGATPRPDDEPHSPLRTIPGRPPDLVTLSPGCPFAPRCPHVADRCREERPPLVSDAPDHYFACWHPVGRAEGSREITAHSPVSTAER